jgi:transposase-like protein
VTPDASEAGTVEIHDEPGIATFLHFEIADGWSVTGEVDLIDGQLAITSLTIHPRATLRPRGRGPDKPRRGLTTSDLRSVRTPQILNRVYRKLASMPGQSSQWEEFLGTPVPWRHRAEKRAGQALEELGPPRRPGGRRKYPADHYERIARLYLDLQEAGINRGILIEIASREGVNRNTARDWVSGATKRGLLSPGGSGVAGRTPGPNLVDYKPPTGRQRQKRKSNRS